MWTVGDEASCPSALDRLNRAGHADPDAVRGANGRKLQFISRPPVSYDTQHRCLPDLRLTDAGKDGWRDQHFRVAVTVSIPRLASSHSSYLFCKNCRESGEPKSGK
jgi:hypothetical protein